MFVRIVLIVAALLVALIVFRFVRDQIAKSRSELDKVDRSKLKDLDDDGWDDDDWGDKP
jgi:hypothetical protein